MLGLSEDGLSLEQAKALSKFVRDPNNKRIVEDWVAQSKSGDELPVKWNPEKKIWEWDNESFQ